MEYKELILEKEGGVVTLTFNRPEKRNALNMGMRAELIHALGELNKDDDVRVLILTGIGDKAFCAGADMQWFGPGGAAPEPTRSDFTERKAWYVPLFRQLRIPTIAAVNGFAVGIGLSFAMICDIRIASDNAKFICGWIRRGLTPDGGAVYLLPQLVGVEKALEMFYTGDTLEAQEAYRVGLVSKVVAPDELMKSAKELAAKIAAGPPIAMELTKDAVYWALESDINKAIDFENFTHSITLKTTDHEEGVRSFLEKRPAQFKGR
ncbi:enoyl-CoA hydratase/isomerase family protein [Chloroflexota bacterium]